MDLLCRGIAGWCKKNGAVSEEDYPIILYGIQVILNTSLKIAGILFVGALLHRLPEVFLSTAVFCSMRYWTGGWHSKSHIGCFCTMLIPCVGSSLLSGISGEWVLWVSEFMAVYSVYKVLRYAPCNSEVNPIEDKGILKVKRVGSIAEVIGIGVAIILIKKEFILLILYPLFINAVLLRRCDN